MGDLTAMERERERVGICMYDDLVSLVELLLPTGIISNQFSYEYGI